MYRWGPYLPFHRKVSEGTRGDDSDLMQVGERLAAAGYVVYGSSTMLVMSTGNGVHGFTLDPEIGEFLLSHENIRIPYRRNIYSCNEGNYAYWTEGVKMRRPIKQPDKNDKRPTGTRCKVHGGRRTCSVRWDLHMYPADLKKDPTKAKGKAALAL